MDAARAAVSKLTGNRGHTTTVEETVAPSVTHEAVKPQRHEEATQAVDREVHQHHHHTTVQPLSHQEVLPEKHSHNILPGEKREFRHDDEAATQQKLDLDMAKFKSDSTVHETRHTQSAAPTVTGEHVHHHVHESVVPVIHKETIQPEVVHTTVPVHEVHHAAAQHHGMSALPMKSLDEFKTAGGSITGGSHATHEQYDGAPRAYNDKLSTTFEKLEQKFHHGSSGTQQSTAGSHNPIGTEQGIAGSHNQTAGHNGNFSTGNTTGNTSGMGALGETGKSHRAHDSGVGGVGHDSTSHGAGVGSADNTMGKKPSLMDRMNPMKDSDGDGKKGLMD